MGITKIANRTDVILGFKKNDSKIMEQIYAKVYPKVKVHILKNNGNENKAKDTFQEAFIACWKNIKADKLTENTNVEAYLFTIAKNKWIDYLRSSDFKKRAHNKGALNVTKVDEDTEVNEILNEENRNAMQRAFEQLGQNCKTLLNLFYFERKSMNEISTVMNVASASARNQKYRCMKELRKLSLEIKNNG